jgi:plastocyanin domain-containing protein
MLQKIIVTFGVLLSVGLMYIAFNIEATPNSLQPTEIVREENGTQYIRILARGGFSPQTVKAKANMPTVLELETKGTYDCSTAIVIPDLEYRNFLPATGLTKIEIPQEKTVSSLTGSCIMGMYYFTIDFGA